MQHFGGEIVFKVLTRPIELVSSETAEKSTHVIAALLESRWKARGFSPNKR